VSELITGAAAPRTYPAVVLEVHDGDTVRVLIDRGGDDFWRTWLRLLGGNTRELAEPGGKEAGDHLRALLAPCTPTTAAGLWAMPVQVVSTSWDKYGGRIDGHLLVPGVGDAMDRMIRDGYAAPWNGRGPRPVVPWPPTPGGTQ